MTSAQIRRAFLDFFKSKEHLVVPSAPIVVKNDPTLMFTNAGMNQFKDYFLGNKKPPQPRVADTQKCLRVSGKHNDLEEVGVDTYHHTMFEMLGNWSFGDYFKKEAIAWSWELLTEVLQLPKDRLYVTVFEGDAGENLPADEEAATEWARWIDKDRILPGNKKDNFWEMGDTGPCGPCTEIHFDSRPEEERKKIDGKTLVNADNPDVIEIWNNVFIQFNRLKDGSLQPLPAKHVDTGMGFERLVRVIQDKRSNYDTDVFAGTLEAIEKISNRKYHRSDKKEDVAFRVIADHIRAISFTIADGQLPSNTGAGYVIRRILRRAVRYYYSYLDYKQPLLHQLVPVLAAQFAEVFPELQQQEAFVSRVVREEEEAFLRTLEKGLNRLEAYTTHVEKHGLGGSFITKENVDSWQVLSDDTVYQNQKRDKVISGEAAFELYDTYGFPLDLTRLIASEKGFTVNEEEFNAAMKQQKDRSRAATTIDAGDWVVLQEGSNEFVGYDSLETEARVLKYRKAKVKGKESYQVVLDKTPFYAESGGQVGDTGYLEASGESYPIIDTRKDNDLIIHVMETFPEEVSGNVRVGVDAARRKTTAMHHSATHLLHAALRKVLGSHVAQKGSLVNADYLRFDFSHFSKMSDDEIKQVETLVNEKIRANVPVVIRSMPREEAMQSGAMALFGEKYADVVRVVTMDAEYSVELCGGTHVGATGELGYFKIVAESAVAAGVRRIEAVSGPAAAQYLEEKLNLLQQVQEKLKQPKDLVRSIQQLQDENQALRKTIERFEVLEMRQLRDQLSAHAEKVNGITYIGSVLPDRSADTLKKLAFEIKQVQPGAVIALASAVDGKASVVLQVDEAVAKEKNLHAGNIIKKDISPLIKGGGGGQPTLATAGGQDASALHQVIETIKNLL